jgi:hypothetical protein
MFDFNAKENLVLYGCLIVFCILNIPRFLKQHWIRKIYFSSAEQLKECLKHLNFIHFSFGLFSQGREKIKLKVNKVFFVLHKTGKHF